MKHQRNLILLGFFGIVLILNATEYTTGLAEEASTDLKAVRESISQQGQKVRADMVPLAGSPQYETLWAQSNQTIKATQIIDNALTTVKSSTAWQKAQQEDAILAAQNKTLLNAGTLDAATYGKLEQLRQYRLGEIHEALEYAALETELKRDVVNAAAQKASAETQNYLNQQSKATRTLIEQQLPVSIYNHRTNLEQSIESLDAEIAELQKPATLTSESRQAVLNQVRERTGQLASSIGGSDGQAIVTLLQNNAGPLLDAKTQATNAALRGDTAGVKSWTDRFNEILSSLQKTLNTQYEDAMEKMRTNKDTINLVVGLIAIPLIGAAIVGILMNTGTIPIPGNQVSTQPVVVSPPMATKTH